MKEERFFYDPELNGELPKDEAQHVLRVLRLQVGDELQLMDGKGNYNRAVITTATGHRCLYRVTQQIPQERAWSGNIHIAVAPTKLNDRMEWFAEKATEIGVDRISFLNCKFSERRQIKTERIGKIVVSAVKQSHKAWMPQIDEMEDFSSFISQDFPGQKFICHCYEGEKPYLFDVLQPQVDATVMVGPEGDFSIDEVQMAIQKGFVPVSLGTSRLRTETAALTAVHMMQIKQQKH